MSDNSQNFNAAHNDVTVYLDIPHADAGQPTITLSSSMLDRLKEGVDFVFQDDGVFRASATNLFSALESQYVVDSTLLSETFRHFKGEYEINSVALPEATATNDLNGLTAIAAGNIDIQVGFLKDAVAVAVRGDVYPDLSTLDIAAANISDSAGALGEILGVRNQLAARGIGLDGSTYDLPLPDEGPVPIGQ